MGCPILEETELFVPDPIWTLTQPDAIATELQRLVDGGVTCLLRPEDGNDLLAQPVAVSLSGGYIDWRLCGADAHASALQAQSRVRVSATLGPVDLLFEGSSFVIYRSDPQAFRCAIPGQVLRVQRREHYRVRMRAYSRGGPSVLFRLEGHRDPLKVRMLDLSVGGCGLLLPQGLASQAFMPGDKLRAVRVELDADMTLLVAAVVRWSTPVRDKDTLLVRLRVGCAWTNMTVSSQRVIQQYLDEVQRKRRMLMKD